MNLPTKKVSVCFVSLGNICRSPMAEGILTKLVTDVGLRGRIRIDSVGTGAWHKGERADKRARDLAVERGYELNSVCRQITRSARGEGLGSAGSLLRHRRGLSARVRHHRRRLHRFARPSA
jgi:hypothetical protein